MLLSVVARYFVAWLWGPRLTYHPSCQSLLGLSPLELGKWQHFYVQETLHMWIFSWTRSCAFFLSLVSVRGYPRVTLCAQLLLCDLSLPWKSGFRSCICNLLFFWQDPVGKSPRAMFTIICTLKPVLMTENMLATCTSCALCTLMFNSICLDG